MTAEELHATATEPVLMWLFHVKDYDPAKRIIAASMAQRPGETPVKRHKRIFGTQTLCWTSWRRNWIWVFPSGLRVYVTNEGGAALEMPVESTLEEVNAALDIYYAALMKEANGKKDKEAKEEA